MEGWKEGQTQGVAQVSLGLRCLLADHGGNRYREVEGRDRVAFVSLLHPTTGLLSEKNGVVGWVLFSSVITVGNDVLSQPLCFPVLASTQGLFFWVFVYFERSGYKEEHKNAARVESLMFNAEL
ncbi:hypothetical protein CHARACLAT_022462 [Characodon lateralis]|uniref:Uncharacterized protein n=1 Tax=Characodon lateralis TaxID=208331 RepID=A0ABU7EC74_9TELE|nr:hypothetical protein [Characodon lateralis]